MINSRHDNQGKWNWSTNMCRKRVPNVTNLRHFLVKILSVFLTDQNQSFKYGSWSLHGYHRHTHHFIIFISLQPIGLGREIIKHPPFIFPSVRLSHFIKSSLSHLFFIKLFASNLPVATESFNIFFFIILFASNPPVIFSLNFIWREITDFAAVV